MMPLWFFQFASNLEKDIRVVNIALSFDLSTIVHGGA
jgi:hypothetical protein